MGCCQPLSRATKILSQEHTPLQTCRSCCSHREQSLTTGVMVNAHIPALAGVEIRRAASLVHSTRYRLSSNLFGNKASCS
jgi:hypothetical protein